MRRLAKTAQIIGNHFAKIAAFLAIDGRLGGLYVARGACFDFDEAQHVFVPADQVDLSVVTWRTEVARDHDVSALAKIKVGVFFATAAGAEMCGSGFLIRWNAIKKMENGVGEAARKHSSRIDRDGVVVCDVRHRRAVTGHNVKIPTLSHKPRQGWGTRKSLFRGQLDALLQHIHRYIRLLFGRDERRSDADRARPAAEEQNAALKGQLNHSVAGV